jgi:SAM-dependent methyltransferase
MPGIAPDLLAILADPRSGQPLTAWTDPAGQGWLRAPAGAYPYAIKDGLPIMLPPGDARPQESYSESELLYNTLMEPALAKAAELLKEGLGTTPPRILDAACGPGGVFTHLERVATPGGTIVGLDFAEDHLAEARKRGAGIGCAVRLVRGDLNEPLPFLEARFDLVWVADVIFPNYFEHATTLVRRLARILKPGGLLAIFYGNWLRPMYLPGYAYLEHLLSAAHELELGERRRWAGEGHPESVRHWLDKAGLAPGLKDGYLEILPVKHENLTAKPEGSEGQGVTKGEETREQRILQYIREYHLRRYQARALALHGADVGLSKMDGALWDRLFNPDHEDYLLNDPHYYCAAFGLLAVGRKR